MKVKKKKSYHCGPLDGLRVNRVAHFDDREQNGLGNMIER
jgi:hypothetical protein